MDDRQIAVDAHHDHRQDAHIAVDAVRSRHKFTDSIAEDPVPRQSVVRDERETGKEQVVCNGKVQDEADSHRPGLDLTGGWTPLAHNANPPSL